MSEKIKNGLKRAEKKIIILKEFIEVIKCYAGKAYPSDLEDITGMLDDIHAIVLDLREGDK